MTHNSLLIEAQNLHLTYPKSEAPALNGVSLHLKQNDFLGLIGPNGAGKTTLISVLTTLLKPDRGSLSICGVDVLQSPAAIRRNIGIVPQDLALFDQLTGVENISYFGKMYGLPTKTIKEKGKYFLEMFGLHHKANKKVATYSGGMKRSLNLIIGILHNPQILFLDEPTVGIDVQSRYVIIEKLAALNRENMAIIYASHYLEEVQQLCKNVIIIDKGEIQASGKTSELIAKAEGCGSLSDVFIQETTTPEDHLKKNV